VNLRPLGYEDGAIFRNDLAALALLSFQQITPVSMLVNLARLSVLGGIAVSVDTK
jgi:hypothetical protein